MSGFSRILGFLRAHLSKDQRRFVKFVVVGASGVPVNLGTVYLATHLFAWVSRTGLRDTLAYLAGILVSIFTNFLLNNAWTWGDRTAADPGGLFGRLWRFYVVSSAAAAIQFFTSVGLSALLRTSEAFSAVLSGEFRVYHAVAPLAGILLGLSINFTANHLWTFRRHEKLRSRGPR